MDVVSGSCALPDLLSVSHLLLLFKHGNFHLQELLLLVGFNKAWTNALCLERTWAQILVAEPGAIAFDHHGAPW